MQEILLYHHLALVTSRTYIYQPFIWRPRFHQALPLSAFLPGPTRDSGVPVSLLDKVCPQDETVYVEVEAFYEDLWGTSQRILKRPERCIVITNRIMHWKYVHLNSIASEPLINIASYLSSSSLNGFRIFNAVNSLL